MVLRFENWGFASTSGQQLNMGLELVPNTKLVYISAEVVGFERFRAAYVISNLWPCWFEELRWISEVEM